MLSNLRAKDRVRAGMVGALALAALGVSADGASAQVFYGYARPFPGAYYGEVAPMPPRVIVYRLQDSGFSEIARPRFDGTAYVVDATNPAGARVRLFLDARNGAVLGRERLEAPYFPSNRVARPAPGYGWTEADLGARRRNDADAPIPPADIPLPRPSLRAEIDRQPALPGRATVPDANPIGVNPDAHNAAGSSRTQPQRRSAKLTPPSKAAPPVSPPDTAAAPVPPAEQAGTRTDPDQAAPPQNNGADPAKAQTPPVTPAANAHAEAPPTERPGTTPAANTDAATTASTGAATQDGGWKDPPASDKPKRNVRVINGATVVPGSGGQAAAETAGTN